MIKTLLAEIEATFFGWLHPGFIPMTIGAAYKIYRTHPTRDEAIDIIISTWMILYCFGDTVLKVPEGAQIFTFVLMGLASTALMHWLYDNAHDLAISKVKSLLALLGLEINVKKANSASNGQTS